MKYYWYTKGLESSFWIYSSFIIKKNGIAHLLHSNTCTCTSKNIYKILYIIHFYSFPNVDNTCIHLYIQVNLLKNFMFMYMY